MMGLSVLNDQYFLYVIVKIIAYTYCTTVSNSGSSL